MQILQHNRQVERLNIQGCSRTMGRGEKVTMRPQVLGFLVVLAAACGGGSSETMANRDASGADAGALAATGKIGPAGGVVSLGAASITIPLPPQAVHWSTSQETRYDRPEAAPRAQRESLRKETT